METMQTEVLIIGAGPVGLILANMLASYGIKTLVLEKNSTYEIEPRAVSIDDESLRSLQHIGLAKKFSEQIVLGYGVKYYDQNNKPLAEIMPAGQEYGYPKRNAFRQPDLVKLLIDNLSTQKNASILFSHQLNSIEDLGLSVICNVATATQDALKIQAKWVVGCDGGRSLVRDLLNVVLDGQTYPQKWLIVDLAERKSSLRHTSTYCDPERPAIRLPGPDKTLRYEFMLHPHDNDQDVLREDVFRNWIRARVPEDSRLPLVRKAIYGFHARIASSWKKNRVLLAGDAAHLTPPFAGQGLNSGIRDATNLAWKLAAVLQWQQPDSLVDSYESERKPHATALIKMALQIGAFMQPKSRLSAFFMQNGLRAACQIPACKDYILQLKFKPKPHFKNGYFQHHAKHQFAQLIPQPQVIDKQGQSLLLDEYLGQGFAVIGWATEEFFNSIEKLVPENLPFKFVALLSKDEDFMDIQAPKNFSLVRDFTGSLGNILDQLNAEALIIRPDRYSYQAIHTSDLHFNASKATSNPTLAV